MEGISLMMSRRVSVGSCLVCKANDDRIYVHEVDGPMVRGELRTYPSLRTQGVFTYDLRTMGDDWIHEDGKLIAFELERKMLGMDAAMHAAQKALREQIDQAMLRATKGFIDEPLSKAQHEALAKRVENDLKGMEEWMNKHTHASGVGPGTFTPNTQRPYDAELRQLTNTLDKTLADLLATQKQLMLVTQERDAARTFAKHDQISARAALKRAEEADAARCHLADKLQPMADDLARLKVENSDLRREIDRLNRKAKR